MDMSQVFAIVISILVSIPLSIVWVYLLDKSDENKRKEILIEKIDNDEKVGLYDDNPEYKMLVDAYNTGFEDAKMNHINDAEEYAHCILYQKSYQSKSTTDYHKITKDGINYIGYK